MYNWTFLDQYLLMAVASSENFHLLIVLVVCFVVCLPQLTLKFVKSVRLGTPNYCEFFRIKQIRLKKEKRQFHTVITRFESRKGFYSHRMKLLCE